MPPARVFKVLLDVVLLPAATVVAQLYSHHENNQLLCNQITFSQKCQRVIFFDRECNFQLQACMTLSRAVHRYSSALALEKALVIET